jgi:glutamate---cysteine ligase / carboxylate-amine ligase
MALSKKSWGLFERYGIELEYMICDKNTLNVVPIADKLIYKLSGTFSNEIEAGTISYSNELALHVIELKTSRPISELGNIDQDFQEHVQRLNKALEEFNAFLMPTGMHPWMDPFKELRLWSHGQNVIYEAYNRIFDCRGHGWANLQSAHLNLSFDGDDELKALHSAIRWLLPIIPALSASSPAADGKLTGFLDTRLETYRHNQRKIPSICGGVIPEPVASVDEYYQKILQPMWKDIAPHDPESILQEEWLNSRGAIVRFDRSAIEIRILDTQECPGMDLAILRGIVDVLKYLVVKIHKGELFYSLMSTEDLAALFLRVVRDGEKALIDHPEYLALFGETSPIMVSSLWEKLLRPFWAQGTSDVAVRQQYLLRHGSLARRIEQRWKEAKTLDEQKEIYRSLSLCLGSGNVFTP